MKKVIAALALGMMIGSTTVALAAPSTVQATVTKLRMIVNGQMKSDTSSQLVYKGTTYVPIRETAGYFGYNTYYNSKFNSIEFASKNELLTKWTTIMDFATLNDYQVRTSESNKDLLELAAGGNTAFSLSLVDLIKAGETIITTTKGNLVHVKYTSGTILLSKEDLKAAGYSI
ncbi:hypothetical protein D3C72_573160 [compost metagenome]